jgi:hypothetical protein
VGLTGCKASDATAKEGALDRNMTSDRALGSDVHSLSSLCSVIIVARRVDPYIGQVANAAVSVLVFQERLSKAYTISDRLSNIMYIFCEVTRHLFVHILVYSLLANGPIK